MDVKLEKGEMICSLCNGEGNYNHSNYVCEKCDGVGKVDWISNAIINKKEKIIERFNHC